MKLSAAHWALIGATATAIAGIGTYEGFRATSYDDGVGRWTIGFGTTTNRQGVAVTPGQTITETEALRTLQWHADRAATGLATCLGDVPLAKHEWDAYVSWAYNVGITAACRSTLVKKLKQTPPDYEGACRELLRWTKAGGKELPGLKRRREQEYQTCSGKSQ